MKKDTLVYMSGVSACVFLCIAVMIWALNEIKQETQAMQKNHCVKTEKSETQLIPQYIRDTKGNVMSTYFIPITNYLYKCDDHERWR